MKASKGNREYSVTEENMQHYVNEGFDIYNDEGEIIKHGKGKTVSLEEHEKLLAELEKERKNAKDSEELIDILKEYASMKEIDIGQATTVNGILKKIKEGSQDGPGGEE